MQKKLPKLIVAFALMWLVFISAALTVSNNMQREVVSAPLRTGFEVLDQPIRYFESASQSNFSAIDFISIRYWSIYLTIFLAALGAFGGLFQIYYKIYGVTKADFSAERRENVLRLACAVACSVVLGTTAVLSSVRKRYLLQKFYVVEVHLVRFEGLIFNSFAISANHKLLLTFFEYLFGYFERIQKAFIEISRAYNFTDEDKVWIKMGELGTAVEELGKRGYAAKDDIYSGVMGDFKGDKTLRDLLLNLEFLQESVRRNIRSLEK